MPIHTIAQWLVALAAVYAVLLLSACALQERIIFYPVQSPAELEQRWQAQRLLIPSGEQGELELEAWWLNNPASNNSVTLLYFGGNAQDVLWVAETMQFYDAGHLLLARYRGYGRNPGRPGEEALHSDAIAVYDHVAAQLAPDPTRIVALGRSIGSGVAVQLASERPLAGVVLITPFDNLAAVGRRHFPWLPVRTLLRHRFAADELAGNIQTPALMLAAGEDTIIPPLHADNLARRWAGPARLETLAGAGHNDIEGHPDFFIYLNRFLAALGGGAANGADPDER